ncbi:MAG: hypothetical protein AB1798_18860, partial [Spirochaetota bacterium]
ERFKDGIRGAVDVIKQYGISPDKAYKIVDSLDTDKLKSIASAIREDDLADKGKVIDIIAEKVDLTGVDTERLKNELRKNSNVTQAGIKRAAQEVEANSKYYFLLLPGIKQVLKDTIKDSEKVLAK